MRCGTKVWTRLESARMSWVPREVSVSGYTIVGIIGNLDYLTEWVLGALSKSSFMWWYCPYYLGQYLEHYALSWLYTSSLTVKHEVCFSFDLYALCSLGLYMYPLVKEEINFVQDDHLWIPPSALWEVFTEFDLPCWAHIWSARILKAQWAVNSSVFSAHRLGHSCVSTPRRLY